MFDIISNEKLEEKAKKLGIRPLIIGKDVTLVDSLKQLKNANTTIVIAKNSERSLLEQPIDGVVDMELIDAKDHLHFRKSGLDQVRAKILANDKKAIILSLSALKKAAQPGIAIGRMIQNSILAKKTKTPILIATFAESEDELVTPHDLEAFFRAIGIDEKTVNKNQKEFLKWVERAKHRTTSKYVGEGVTKTL